MSIYLRYLLVLFISLSQLFGSCVAKQPAEEAVNNPKYLSGIIQVAVLPENFKPSKSHEHGQRRLIFIGDIHGAYEELVSLLEKVEYKSSTGIIYLPHIVNCLDHVVFLGDLVAKGPHSLKVVKLAMKINASCVIGNHDYELLDWMGYIDSVGDSRFDMFVNPEDLPNEHVLGAEEHTIAMGFDNRAAEWMLKCPLILRVGNVDGEELVAVHAGLLPGKSIQNQGYFLFDCNIN